MNPIYFSALLKTQEEGVLEIGQAAVAPDENTLTFTSDFVPLMQLGSQATVTRVIGDWECESYTGTVYLSSQKLLRIVDVDPQKIELARELFGVNALYPGEFYLSPNKNPKNNIAKLDSISGFLRYVSLRTVRICTMEYVEEKQHLLFSLDAPELPLVSMVVRVNERILLERSSAVLICDVVSISSQNSHAIREYMERYAFGRRGL